MPKLRNKSKVQVKSKKRTLKQSKRFKKSPRKRHSLKLKSGLRGGSIDYNNEKYKDIGINPEKSGFVEYLQKTPYKIASYFDSTAKSTAGFIKKAFSF